jgi:hypothetical protein
MLPGFTNVLWVILCIIFVVYVMWNKMLPYGRWWGVESMIGTIDADFQNPRAYFHPFTTDYESYSIAWLPPWDPREQRDEEMRVSSVLSM